ncbi:MAG: putative type nitrate/sulfonate/bicarbonate transport system, permease component, partial [Variovorax sp.]|nr:putative type nitrate/sulfonate/bicarbonate transport system, permease component [Variovorax sp.]
MNAAQRRRAERWAPLIAGTTMLLLWQLVCSGFQIAEFIFPSPWA